MARFPAYISPGMVTSVGFQITGGLPSSATGWVATSVGDINGDGVDDMILGATGADINGSDSGGAFVVFGRLGGFAGPVDLATLDGSNGFRISGEAFWDRAGLSVAPAGDFNGDGIDDLLIGALGNDVGGSYSGAAYVVFGRQGGFAANLELSALDGLNGVKINGEAPSGQAGFSVSSAGDVNGDGVDDLIIGARLASDGGARAGAAYVVFGSDDPFGPSVNLSALDGSNGFQLNGEAGFYAGVAVSAAGDVNGDGLGDLLVGASEAPGGANGDLVVSGRAYLIFGRSTPFDATTPLETAADVVFRGGAALTYAGKSLASAGDINGDGFDDLLIGAYRAQNGAGAAYVVFGGAGLSGDILLSSLDGSNGFRIGSGGQQTGRSVASVGDLNKDGFDDLALTAGGAAYVIFGAASGFGSTYNPLTVDGLTGFMVAPDFEVTSVASAGDVNDDGYDDLILGQGYAGGATIVYGHEGAFVGNNGDQVYTGDSTAETLSGLGGKDTLYGLGGNDIIDGGSENDLLYGGDGADDLVGGLGGDTLYGDAGADELSGGDGADKLYGGTGQDLLNGGTGNDRMDGESDIDTLNGGAGNDLLDGGLGADIMSGGADNDVYIVDDAGDQTLELAGGGYDIVRTTLNWTLASEVEALELQGVTDANGTGNSGANNMQGNSGANTLSGLAGNDTLNGNDGDDIIIGGQGGDLLRGGLGQDTFLVAHVFGGGLETDQIYDFSTAEGDIMDFSALFAGTIDEVAAFTNTAGQMTLTFAGGVTTVKLDIDGNGVAEYWARINGDVTGDWSGWLL